MSILREVVNILPIPYYYVLCREQQPFHIGEHTMNTNTKDRGRTQGRTTASSSSNKLRGIALALLLGFLLLVPQSARGGEIAIVGGYGLLDAPSPFAKVSLSFGKRVVVDFNGGVVFAKPDKTRFAVLTRTFDLRENIEGVEIPHSKPALQRRLGNTRARPQVQQKAQRLPGRRRRLAAAAENLLPRRQSRHGIPNLPAEKEETHLASRCGILSLRRGSR